MIVTQLVGHFFIFICYLAIYIIIKIVEFSFGLESILQSAWNCIFDNLGDDLAFYNIWVLNVFTFGLVWTINGSFAFVEHVVRPKSIDDYKIKIRENEFKGKVNVPKVSKIINARCKNYHANCRSFW
jgi:hypothetical protein